MASLYLDQGSDEVLAVLEDGVHPGRKVVQNPRVWNSRPFPKFRSVHVPGERASVFAALLKPERDTTDPTNIVHIDRREFHLDVQAMPLAEQAALARDRTVILTAPQVVARPRS